MQAERLRLDLVRERLAGRHRREDAVHAGWMRPVEVNRVIVRPGVGEVDAQDIAFAAADRRAGNPPVVGPGVEGHAGCHLDSLVHRHELILPKGAPVPKARDLSGFEFRQVGDRVELRGVDLADGEKRMHPEGLQASNRVPLRLGARSEHGGPARERGQPRGELEPGTARKAAGAAILAFLHEPP